MEKKLKLYGKYDIQDDKLVRVTYKPKDKLLAVVRYSEEMGTIYFVFEMGDMAQKVAVTKAIDVDPPFGLPLESAWDSFCEDVVYALKEATWKGDCPLWHEDVEYVEGAAEEMAKEIFKMRAEETLESIV